jgi:hypothetical protein
LHRTFRQQLQDCFRLYGSPYSVVSVTMTAGVRLHGESCRAPGRLSYFLIFCFFFFSPRQGRPGMEQEKQQCFLRFQRIKHCFSEESGKINFKNPDPFSLKKKRGKKSL